MRQGIALLDEAVGVAREEISALNEGEYESASRLASRRGELVNSAWNLLDAASREKYRERLLELKELQAEIMRIAREAHAAVRDRLQNSRRQRRCMKGYGLAVSQALQ